MMGWILVTYLIGALINFIIMDYVVRSVTNYSKPQDKVMVIRFTLFSWLAFIVIVFIAAQALGDVRRAIKDRENKT